MSTSSVKYKDWVLGKGSEGYKLFQEKKFKDLDKHLKNLENESLKLIQICDKSPSKKGE